MSTDMMRTTARQPRRGVRFRLGASAAVAALLLTGCAPTDTIAGLHPPPPENLSVAPLSAPAASAIAARVLQSAQVAASLPLDDAGNAERAAVTTGSYSEWEKARLAVSGVPAAQTDLTRPDVPTVIAISRGKGFPRVILATTLDATSKRQYLESFVSAEIAAPFRLEHRIPMLPGAKLPGVGELAAGAPLVAPEAEDGLVMSPAAALQAYAGALNHPTPTANELVDSTDSYAAALVKQQKAQTEALGSLASYAVTHTVVPEVTRAVQLTDGSVVVFGQINRSDVITAAETAKELTVPEAFQKVTGASTATSSITINFMQPVVLHVPASGQGKVMLLGVTEQLVSGSTA